MTPDPATRERVICENPDHGRPRPAVFRVTYPSGRFNPTTACAPCARWLILECAKEAGGAVFEAVRRA